ncbi:MAG: glycosyltransferase family 2 protein [Gaiellaceae bacterium]
MSGAATPTVTVLTATYNRKALLPRLRESLLAQSFTDFEWVIIDDGSTDGTDDLVRTWQASRSFPIRYFWQPNAGRHIAFNRGVQEARGAYCAVIDSDDWYPPNALGRMIEQWSSIPAEDREDFANVEGLCAFPDGRPVESGRPMPQKVLDSDNFSIVARHRVLGDKMGMYRTAVLREFPFPSIRGEYVTEDVVFLEIANRYASRFVDEVWGFKEYQAGGITEAVDAGAQSFALGFRLSNKALIALDRPKPVTVLLKGYANFTRYSLHAGVGLRQQIAEAPQPLLWLATSPLGFFLYFRDSARARTR